MHNIVSKAYQVPLPSAGQKSLMERLQSDSLRRKNRCHHSQLRFRSLFNFIKLADTLKIKIGIRTFLPTLEQFEERHKYNLTKFGEKYDINIPKSKTIFPPMKSGR